MAYYPVFKRLFDLLLSALILLAISPIFILIMFLLAVENRGSMFFFQLRPGLNEKPFFIIKFKTMKDYDANQYNDEHDLNRLTLIGKYVRKFSFDELPQLINILKGDMSLVGPRPLLMEYLPLYSNEQSRRHSVRPGVTGWAQVNGRNSISWTRKFELDIEYINNLSFSMDVKILFLTFWKVFKREGVNQSESRPMQPFNGHN